MSHPPFLVWKRSTLCYIIRCTYLCRRIIDGIARKYVNVWKSNEKTMIFHASVLNGKINVGQIEWGASWLRASPFMVKTTSGRNRRRDDEGRALLINFCSFAATDSVSHPALFVFEGITANIINSKQFYTSFTCLIIYYWQKNGLNLSFLLSTFAVPKIANSTYLELFINKLSCLFLLFSLL